MAAPARRALDRRAALLAGAALAAIGCARASQAAPTPAPPPAASASSLAPSPSLARAATLGTTSSLDEGAIRAGIQETLDKQAAAIAAAHRATFDATIDQRNLTWRRIQGDVFASTTARGPQPATTYRVSRIQPKQAGYVKAWIDVLPPGQSSPTAHGVWVFRPTETGWLHSEILNEEIGPRKRFETEHFTLLHYEWDDDVIERVAGITEQGYDRVTSKTGIVTRARLTVSVNPTFGSHSLLRSVGTVAVYLSSADQIVTRSLESYGAGLVAPGEQQDGRLLTAFTHEYGHAVNDAVVSTARIPKWMSEGFAEYVADNLRPHSMAAALAGRRTISLDRASEMIEWFTDPARGFTAEDLDRAYTHSAHATQYFMERFGQERFFALAAEFAETRQWEPALVSQVGITWQDFERDWLAWTRARYGL